MSCKIVRARSSLPNTCRETFLGASVTAGKRLPAAKAATFLVYSNWSCWGNVLKVPDGNYVQHPNQREHMATYPTKDTVHVLTVINN